MWRRGWGEDTAGSYLHMRDARNGERGAKE